MRPMTVIDDYIAAATVASQDKLTELCALIRELMPEGTVERISYRMPTFWLQRNLVHFAGYEAHVGLYPGPEAIAAFEDELKPFKHAKGSVQFPLDRPLPVDLITRIVKYQVARIG